ncbi:MAG: hypothetical protein ACI9GW_001301 [Halieaceae bacterium]|jgi:uncharacterized protein YdiU (UPF0061 family)
MDNFTPDSALNSLNFDNRFTRELPGDPAEGRHPRTVEGACYSRVLPTPVSSPQLLAYSKELGASLGLDEACHQSDQFLKVFAGNEVLPGMDPFAMCYGGHQFGNWAGQLGDGRAINLGEVVNPEGERWVLQLKGAGLTPYSRTADGLAVIRSSVREFLCSEAMHHLGVPTTRALSLIGTGEDVLRDMFYDGRAGYEPGAIVCRVAPSFLRFGSFQILAARRDLDLLRKLVEYTIRTDFPELIPVDRAIDGEAVLAWFTQVCRRTAVMVAHWMRVGFVHGVMNTDNMSILGLTIDYGPYGWLEDYDPDWTPNTTDAQGKRYRFGAQPSIASWNLAQLANAIYPLCDLGEEIEPLQNALNQYSETFADTWHETMRQKLGMDEFRSDTDIPLFEGLSSLMQQLHVDMTCFYRELSNLSSSTLITIEGVQLPPNILTTLYDIEEVGSAGHGDLCDWLHRYGERLTENSSTEYERKEMMDKVNPKYVLRNYLAQLAIDKVEQGDTSLLQELFEVLKNPYMEQQGKEQFAAMRPDWARHRAGCSMLSCSS